MMNAEDVKAYVSAKWPGLLQSPLAQAMHGASAMLLLEASDADAVVLRSETMAHALSCIDVCDAQGIEYTEETLSHNVESSFPDLDMDECDEIACAAITKARSGAHV